MESLPGQIDKSLDEASLSLRAGSLRTITHILLPLLRPAILSALIYSFVRAITTVSAIVFLVTPDTRALILKPKVLLFDEPLSNLDANLRRSMRDKIRELQKQFDITSLYVTHDQSEAFAVSDTVLVMNKGHIMQIGSPQDLYRQPASRFMASFMGDANLFPATFSDGYVDIYGYHLPRPLHFGTQGEGMVGVRPEAIAAKRASAA